MVVKAQQKFIRISPRKVRLAADVVRDLRPEEALEQLEFMRKRGAQSISKVIKQALANAKNQDLQEEALRFKAIEVGEGPIFKRWRAVSRGRAHKILKRTSHITIVLESVEEDSLEPVKSTPFNKKKRELQVTKETSQKRVVRKNQKKKKLSTKTRKNDKPQKKE